MEKENDKVMNKNIKDVGVSCLAHILLIIAFTACVIPLVVVVAASFSDEIKLLTEGYGFWPRGFSLSAYKVVFANGDVVANAYILTTVTTIVGSVLSVLIIALAAFPLSRRDYPWKKCVNLYLYFTMIFSGGAVSSYIWISQTLHLRNNPLVLVLPSLVSAYNIFLMRTYMSNIPHEMVEAAKIDGANEFQIFFSIILPMTTVGIATIFVMTALGFWNQWYASLMYLDDKYITLQYYLIRVMNNIDMITKSQNTQNISIDLSKMPSEATRMAMCVVSAGPMIFIFAFFQKYFVSGISVGSVKG